MQVDLYYNRLLKPVDQFFSCKTCNIYLSYDVAVIQWITSCHK